MSDYSDIEAEVRRRSPGPRKEPTGPVKPPEVGLSPDEVLLIVDGLQARRRDLLESIQRLDELVQRLTKGGTP